MPNPIDWPQALQVLRPGQDWGPGANTDSTYPALVAGWRGAQAVPLLAELQAAWDTLEANRAATVLAARRVATAALATAPDAAAQLVRAELLVTMDELNTLRQWVTTFKAAVAAASTLADLKTRVAALANLPDRTAAQIKPALVARISTPDAD